MRILLIGPAGSGKSTIAYWLMKEYGFKEFALGNKVKELTFLLLKLFNVEIDSIEDLYNIETKNKYRKYLQMIGTDCCRKVFGEDFWCKQLEESISTEKNIVISDVRFINEFNYFNKGSDTISIKIVGRKFENENDMYKHRSETELDEIETDYIIDNSKDIGYLFDQLDKIINEFNEPYVNEKEYDVNGLGNNYETSYELVLDNKKNDERDDENDDENEPYVNEKEYDNDNDLTLVIDDNDNVTKVIEDEPTILKDEPTILKDDIIESKNTISSKEKGVIGEEAVCSLIRKINPKLDVILVSSTGHLADIHVIDYKNNIKYIVEVKYKQIITRDDIVKFEKDVESMKKSDNNKIVGLFLSINSDNIISIGRYHIDFDMIYLTSKFINEQTLSMIFDIISLEYKLSKVKQKHDETNIKYEIPPNVLHLIAQLQAEYTSINHEKETYLSMKHNTERNLCFIQELLGKLVLKEQFIKLINDEFNDILPIVSVSVSDNEENKLREYISTTNKKDIRKKNLLTMFPVLSTQLGSMKLQDIFTKYGGK